MNYFFVIRIMLLMFCTVCVVYGVQGLRAAQKLDKCAREYNVYRCAKVVSFIPLERDLELELKKK